jgi:hypothetical protein
LIVEDGAQTGKQCEFDFTVRNNHLPNCFALSRELVEFEQEFCHSEGLREGSGAKVSLKSPQFEFEFWVTSRELASSATKRRCRKTDGTISLPQRFE